MQHLWGSPDMLHLLLLLCRRLVKMQGLVAAFVCLLVHVSSFDAL